MSTTDNNGQTAWPSVGTIVPKEEIDEQKVPQNTPASNGEAVSQDTLTRPRGTQVTTHAKPSFESTLEPWILANKPKSKWMWISFTKWWLYARLTKYQAFKWLWRTPPKTLSRAGARAEIRENEQYVNDNRRVSFNASTVSQGGGSTKTTTINTIASYTSQCIGNGVALMGLDIGADKTVSRYAQEEGDVLPTTQLVKWLEQGYRFYPKDLVPYTTSDAKSGLILFKAKLESELDTLDYAREQSARLLKYMVRLYPVLFCDGGPGQNLMTSEGMLESSDIVVLPKKGISKESTADIWKVIHHPPYNLEARLDRVIVVISAVKKSQLNTRTQDDIAKRCGVDPTHVVLIPNDRYLDDQVMVNLKQVDINALSLETRLMYSRLMKLAVQIAVSFQPPKVRIS